MPNVSIVIVNWNTRELLLECLRSILENGGASVREVIVVDNASSDGSAEAVKSEFPDARVIENGENRGFGAACNQGVAECTGDLLLLLNPDTIVQAGAIDGLVGFLVSHEDVGIVGPLLVGTDGAPQISSFGLYPSLLEAWLRAYRVWRLAPKSGLAKRFLVVPDGEATWTHAAHLLGACLLIRRGVFDELAGFDEDFRLFLEETDLCYRAGERGWRCAYFIGARITHVGEQSMQEILHRTGALYIRSYNLFCRKRGMGAIRRLGINVFLATGILIDALMGLVKYGSSKRAADSLSGLYHAYFGDSGGRLPGRND